MKFARLPITTRKAGRGPACWRRPTARWIRRRSCRWGPAARSRRCRPGTLAEVSSQIILCNTYHLFIRPGRRRHPRPRRPALVHGLAGADPHRQRRLPGAEPRRHAQDHRGGGVVPVPSRRLVAFPEPGEGGSHPAGAGGGRGHGAGRVHPVSVESGVRQEIHGAHHPLGATLARGAPEPATARSSGSSRAGSSGTCGRIAPRGWARFPSTDSPRADWGSARGRSCWRRSAASPPARCRTTVRATSWASESPKT